MSEKVKTEKVKVAVLGGGAGALSAALALTDPARGDRYEVTVYTLGWRLGGKGASGRNPKFGQRIEEHGIHVWFGFYDNAFRLLEGCYEELRTRGWRTPEGRPVQPDHCVARGADDPDAAFHPHESFVVNEQRADSGKWSKWPLQVPRNTFVPGDGRSVKPEASLAFVKLAEMLQSMTEIREARARDPKESQPAPPPTPPPVNETPEEVDFRRYVEGRARPPHESAGPLEPEDFLRHALDGLAAPALDDALPKSSKEALIDGDTPFRLRLRFIAWTLRCARQLIRGWTAGSEKAHRLYLACDTFAAMATGIYEDVFRKGDPEKNVDALDALDLRDWLRQHGADPEYVDSNPTVRFIYNSAFAFEDGDHKKPSIAAGSALRGVMRLFLTYKGAFAYRMAAGMGDVVFSPIYQVLRERGVTFKFFHRVDGLRLAKADDRPVVDEIRVAEQVRLAGEAYDPFVWVNDFPCWPHEPRFDQLASGGAIRQAVENDGLNLEDPGARWQEETAHTLRRGEHFDHVVLGIPVEALKPIAGELCDYPSFGPAWTAMLAKTATTPTQGFQIWSRGSLKDLGWEEPAPVFGTYVEPIDTYIDMTPALRLEERRADDVKALSYFCGVFERRPGETTGDAMSRAVDSAVEHLVKHCSYIWSAVGKDADFKWALLWNATGKTAREKFLAGQFARANVLPSELYTLNLPGTLQYRLRPDAALSGGAPDNLWLAGDWTRNTINLGCVEATVMTGLAAARGLVGKGSGIEIIGERDDYMWQAIGRGERVLSSYESLKRQPEVASDPIAPTTWGDDGLKRLKQAVASFDGQTVANLCAALIERLRNGETPIDAAIANGVLSTLRRKRHFALMREVADACIQAGVDTPKVRRQYAQALIDDGDLTAGLAVLQDVAADSNLDVGERAEGLGLTGRVHKQRYVNAPRSPRAADWLRSAIDSYNRGYGLGTSTAGWHAVNMLAVIARARVDGVGLPNLSGIAGDEGKLAREALRLVGEKREMDLNAWDYAIKAEANLALGKNDEAFSALKQYAARQEADAFEVNSTLRQLEEVWQLTPDTPPGASLIPFLQAELLARKGGKLDLSPGELRDAHSRLQRSRLQKIFGDEPPVSLEWYRTGLDRCRLVARITDQFKVGGGTGFLVRAGDLQTACAFPDELVLVTNAHVLEPFPTAAGTLMPHQALVRFEAAPEPTPVHRIASIVWTSSERELDATIARLDPAPTGLAGCPIAAADSPPAKNARVFVIGHPRGGALSLSLYDNLLIDRNDRLLHYRAPTEPGSSGSPVFNQDWALVGLHHAGDREMPRLNGQAGVYAANEGIWIEAIRKALNR